MRALLPFVLPMAAGACASATQPAAPLEAVGVGIVSRLDGEGARAGISFAYWTAGYRGWGAFAKLRMDAVVGLDLMFDDDYDDDDRDHDHDHDDPYLDDYVGAVVYDMGLVYRFADNFAVYGGAGIGNLYEYTTEQVSEHRWERHVHTLDWDPNFTTGILWLWGASGGGLDFGFDTFDRSFRLAFVVNYGGGSENWFD